MMIPTLPWLVHDPVITTLPKVKQAADSTAMPLAAGNKSSDMPLKIDDTSNRGTSVTFEATSF